jgi:exonuclease I
MCLTCGCLLPHDNHGKPDYLLIEDLEKSAKLDGYSLDEAVSNLVATVEVAKKESEHQHS